MLFKTRFHDGLRDGSIVRSYRRWQSPRVKVGGQYRFAGTDAIEVTRIEQVAAAAIDEEAARHSGFESVLVLRKEIERASRAPLEAGDVLTCVHFRYVELEPRPKPPRRVSQAEVAAMVERIDAMEQRAKDGPWVWQTLDLIERNPQRRAGDLADILGAELKPFKSRVRRLKGLGLTESFAVGYGVTTLGRATLDEDRRRN